MSSGRPKSPKPPAPPPTAEGPEIEAAKRDIYTQMLRKKGRAASDVTGGLGLISPVQQQVSTLKKKFG